jgi:hypothetical protein
MYHGQETVTMLGLAGEVVVLALEEAAAAAADLEVDLALARLGVWTILEGRSVKAAVEAG